VGVGRLKSVKVDGMDALTQVCRFRRQLGTVNSASQTCVYLSLSARAWRHDDHVMCSSARKMRAFTRLADVK